MCTLNGSSLAQLEQAGANDSADKHACVTGRAVRLLLAEQITAPVQWHKYGPLRCAFWLWFCTVNRILDEIEFSSMFVPSSHAIMIQKR